MTANTARAIVIDDRREGMASHLFSRLSAHFADATARQQLRSLDDHVLRDIGVTHSDIELRRLVK